MGIDVTVPEQRCQVSYRDAVDDVRMHVYISCVLWYTSVLIKNSNAVW